MGIIRFVVGAQHRLAHPGQEGYSSAVRTGFEMEGFFQTLKVLGAAAARVTFHNWLGTIVSLSAALGICLDFYAV